MPETETGTSSEERNLSDADVQCDIGFCWFDLERKLMASRAYERSKYFVISFCALRAVFMFEQDALLHFTGETAVDKLSIGNAAKFPTKKEKTKKYL